MDHWQSLHRRVANLKGATVDEMYLTFLGGGYAVYLVGADKQLDTSVVADTFGTDQVTDPVFVSEQMAYREQHFAKERAN